ncbi:hypothetical protein HN51_006145 [Arachis hypogaea]
MLLRWVVGMDEVAEDMMVEMLVGWVVSMEEVAGALMADTMEGWVGVMEESGYGGDKDDGGGFGDYFVKVLSSDEAVHERQTYISLGEILSGAWQ